MNREQYVRIDSETGNYTPVISQDIQVGNLLFLKCNETMPADLLVLTTSLPNGLCFVETSQLDGYVIKLQAHKVVKQV